MAIRSSCLTLFNGRHAATPSDTYELDADPTDLDPWFYTKPHLGYIGSYRLGSLPTGFSLNYEYAWEIWAYSPDGGYGISYEARVVKFSNTGSIITAPSLDLPEKRWQLRGPPRHVDR